jgi:enoyl-CoA hydratase
MDRPAVAGSLGSRDRQGPTPAEEAAVTDGEFVRLEVEDGVATIRLDRPPMNALNVQVQEELRAAAFEAGQRPDIAAVVLYGGEKVFAAGADIKEMATMTYADMVARSGALQSSFTSVARIPKPVIAAITGYALGGGCELTLCADLRVCGDNAKLGQPEIQLGVIPGAGGTQRLTRLVGPSRAKELIFTGRFVDADEALRIGLVDKVVPADEVYTAAREMAARFVGGPAVALRAAKDAIDRGMETDLDTGLEIERLHFSGLFATEDRGIGMTSFVEQGPGKAKFVGR